MAGVNEQLKAKLLKPGGVVGGESGEAQSGEGVVIGGVRGAKDDFDGPLLNPLETAELGGGETGRPGRGSVCLFW